MTMDKQALEARKIQIDSAIEKQMNIINSLSADLNAMHGNRAEVIYWLGQIEAEKAAIPLQLTPEEIIVSEDDVPPDAA